MTTALDILVKARATIELPGQWTKGALARDSHGKRTNIFAPYSTCFCSIGAVGRALDETFGSGSYRQRAEGDRPDLELLDAEVCAALDESARTAHHLNAVRLNDAHETTHTDVMAMFDRAIAMKGA